MATPVGRRWILKAGLGSAAAIAVAHLPGLSRSAGATPSSTAAHARVAGQPARTANRTLHFALGPAMAAGGLSNLVLAANGASMPLVAHTPDSRAALQAQGGVFAAANLAALTHFVAGRAAARRQHRRGLGLRYARQHPGGRGPDVARPGGHHPRHGPPGGQQRQRPAQHAALERAPAVARPQCRPGHRAASTSRSWRRSATRTRPPSPWSTSIRRWPRRTPPRRVLPRPC